MLSFGTKRRNDFLLGFEANVLLLVRDTDVLLEAKVLRAFCDDTFRVLADCEGQYLGKYHVNVEPAVQPDVLPVAFSGAKTQGRLMAPQ